MISLELQTAIDRRKRMLARVADLTPEQANDLFETIDLIATARAREACVFAMSSLVASLGGSESDLREQMAQFELLKLQGRL